MNENDVVVGQKYRVKKGLPKHCWNSIFLVREGWEGKMVEVRKAWGTKEVCLPSSERPPVPVMTWMVGKVDKRGSCWFPAFALESICMFEEVDHER